MSEETAGDGGAADQAEGSEFGINVHTQYIKDLSVENPNAPMIFMEMEQGPEVNVNLDVEATRLQEGVYETVLHTTVNATVQDKTAFAIELKYAGLISLEDSVAEDQRETLVLIETPRFLFPFAREIISSSARDAGFPPLLINPVNFTQLYQRHKARRTGEEATQH